MFATDQRALLTTAAIVAQALLPSPLHAGPARAAQAWRRRTTKRDGVDA